MYRGRDQGPSGGAEHLARIHGTEEDKVNCPFYFKIGACRHGDKCSRQHHRPPFSETVLIKHMWNNPMISIASAGGNADHIDKDKFQEALDDFYEEIYEEFKKYGKLEDIQVCENLGDHMVGNVYIKFYDEEEAQEALMGLNGRYYACRPLTCEYSPVTEFREARCRQFDEGKCNRGAYCNFMHVCEPSTELRRHLQKEYDFRGGRMKGTGTMDSLRGGGGGGGYRGGRQGGGGGGGYGGGGRDYRDRGYGGGGGGGGGGYRDRDYGGGGGGGGRDYGRGDSYRGGGGGGGGYDRDRRRGRSSSADREDQRDGKRARSGGGGEDEGGDGGAPSSEAYAPA